MVGIANNLEWPFKVISGTINGFTVCISRKKQPTCVFCSVQSNDVCLWTVISTVIFDEKDWYAAECNMLAIAVFCVQILGGGMGLLSTFFVQMLFYHWPSMKESSHVGVVSVSREEGVRSVSSIWESLRDLFKSKDKGWPTFILLSVSSSLVNALVIRSLRQVGTGRHRRQLARWPSAPYTSTVRDALCLHILNRITSRLTTHTLGSAIVCSVLETFSSFPLWDFHVGLPLTSAFPQKGAHIRSCLMTWEVPPRGCEEALTWIFAQRGCTVTLQCLLGQCDISAVSLC